MSHHLVVQRQCDTSLAEEGRRRSEVLQRNRNVRMPRLPKSLSSDEKKYLLAVERGDLATVRRMIQQAHRDGGLDINCMDPLGRNALLMAIESEQFAMVELLIVMGVKTADALLHAIEQEFVEAVELLLEHEELIHKEGELYSWESIDRDIASFTPEITPLILAAHQNNYEILKILLDRGATLPMPHDIRCACDDCVRGVREDSLRHSASRINSYKALASPSLIALTSVDPLLTAFELSWELKQLTFSEKEFRVEYLELRMKSQSFAVDLLSHTRTTHELEVMLNYDPHIMKDEDDISVDDLEPGESQEEGGLARLRLAIDYKQKKVTQRPELSILITMGHYATDFVAHSWVQQLLAAIWYDGLPGFRQKTTTRKCLDIARIIVAFPFYCVWYMLAPKSNTGKLLRKPFMKFLIHSSSYLFFLLLLILVSQRVEEQLFEWWKSRKHETYSNGSVYRTVHRGNPPTYLELLVALYLLGYILEEARELLKSGFKAYTTNLWNSIDFLRNFLYVMVFVLRSWAYLQQRHEISMDAESAYIPREHWDDFDPQLIAEGLFAAANIFSALKLVQISSINPHLGPLQISLGRMVVDILKFFFFYSLVLFAFACGLNQLLWYFADLEKAKCYSLPGGLPDWNKNAEACMKWRRFGNLFESSQSLFWASFGMVSLADFELTGIKSYTRFWGLLMFGSYSVINVIVLLNLLIAMMSNSYAMITEKADTEWKFARTKLWLTYFDEDATLPSPFNLFPTFKQIKRIFMRFLPNFARKNNLSKHKEARLAELREQAREYTAVMRALVWRYVSGRQRKSEENPVTEDDINEIKTEVSTLRCDIFEIFRNNGYKVNSFSRKPVALSKKTREWERRLFRGFHVAPAAGDEEILMRVESDMEKKDDDDNGESKGADRFRRMARLALMNRERLTGPPKHLAHIGKSTSSESFRSRQSLKKAMADAQRMVLNERGPSPIPPSPEPDKILDDASPGKKLSQDAETNHKHESSFNVKSGADIKKKSVFSNLSAEALLKGSQHIITGKSKTGNLPIMDQPVPTHTVSIEPAIKASQDSASVSEPKSPSTASTGSNKSNTSAGKRSPRLRELSNSQVSKSFPEVFEPPIVADTMISMEVEIPQKLANAKSIKNVESSDIQMGHPGTTGAIINFQPETGNKLTEIIHNANPQTLLLTGAEPIYMHVTDEAADDVLLISDEKSENGDSSPSMAKKSESNEGNLSVNGSNSSNNTLKMDLPIVGQRVEGVKTIKRPSMGGSWF